MTQSALQPQDVFLEQTQERLERAHAVDSVPWKQPKGELVTISSRNVSVSVAPHDTGRITSIKAFGHELLRQYEEGRTIFQYGAFPMTPWVGRVGAGLLYYDGHTYQLPINQKEGFSIHGLGRLGTWTLDYQHDNEMQISLDLSDNWYWPATTSMHVAVEDTTVRVTQTLQALTTAFPGQLGLHPWFLKHITRDNSDEAVTLQCKPEWQAQRASNYLPTGERIAPTAQPWDDTFGFFPHFSAQLTWQDMICHLESNHAYATIYTYPQDSICVEPQTSIPNAINAQPQSTIVTPERELQLVSQFDFYQL